MSLPDDWPAHPDLSLALNRMGSFDWDYDSGLLHLDPSALEVLGLPAESYDSRPQTVTDQIPPYEAARLEAHINRSIRDHEDSYGAYYRIRDARGALRWIHAQAHIKYDGEQPLRIIGIVRGADEELAEAAARNELDEGRRRLTDVVEGTTALLASAGTVKEVMGVLRDEDALGHLGAVNVILGVLEGGRLMLSTEGRADQYDPQLESTKVEAPLPISEAVRTERPIFVSSRQEYRTRYPELWPVIEPLRVGSGAYLPLIAQGRTIGALALLYPERGEFRDEERNLLVTLGSSIAQSLQRAMLFEQEHDLAEGLQQAMLPRYIPNVPGARVAVRYRSARLGRNVGGDWYDVIPLPGGQVGVTIGDVQGHDTDASVVMGQLRMVLWAYAAEGHPPATAMARTSTFLNELDTDRFATCTYVQVDMTTGQLRIVRAGHLDALLRRADGSSEWIAAAGGLPLGLSADFAGPGGINYPVTSGVLGPGETLLLCTDGLVELPGIDLGNRLEVLRQTVSSGPSDIEELADLLGHVVGDQGGSDDVAMVLLQRDGAGAPERIRTW